MRHNPDRREALQRISISSLGQRVELAGNSIDAIAVIWLDRVESTARLAEVQFKRRAIERDYIERNAGEDAHLMLTGPLPEAFLSHPLRGRRLAALMAIRRASVAGDSLPRLVPEMMQRDPDTEVRRCAVETYRECYSRSNSPEALKRLAGIVLDESQEKIVRSSAYEAMLDAAKSSYSTSLERPASRGAPNTVRRRPKAAAGPDWTNGVDWNFVHQCRNGLVKDEQATQENLPILAGLEAVLEVKFGAAARALVSEIQQIDDLELLREILVATKRAATPDAIRQLWGK
jgi:hypothetical protein